MPKVKQFDEQEVLEKAIILFRKKGYYDTSMNDIVKHLGISRSSLYATFPSGKKELYDKALQQYSCHSNHSLTDLLKQQENVRDTIKMMLENIIQDNFCDKDAKGCMIVNTTTELVPDDENSQKMVIEHRKTMEGIFYNFLKKGVDTGQISPEKDIKIIASLIYTFMSGLRIVGKTKPIPEDSIAMVDTILTFLD